MRTVARILGYIKNISYYPSTVYMYLPVIMMCFMLYEVVSRHIFDSPTIWSFELTGMIMGPFWMLASSLSVARGQQITLDILWKRLSTRMQGVVDMVTWLFFIYYVSLVMYFGYQEFIFSWVNMTRSRSFWMPLYWPWKMWIPISSAMVLLQGIVYYFEAVYKVVTGKVLKIKWAGEIIPKAEETLPT